MAWLVLVLSIAAVALLYWLIRRSPATGFASLFYLVPAVTAFFAFILFDERLDSISILGMVICAGGVALVNRGTSSSSTVPVQSRSKRSRASSPKSG
jgi:drug/metabolite transporter (DMT)-like permease